MVNIMITTVGISTTSNGICKSVAICIHIIISIVDNVIVVFGAAVTVVSKESDVSITIRMVAVFTVPARCGS